MAGPFDEPIDDVTIVIGTEPFPYFESITDAESVFAREAAAVADALTRSLPGGTLDRLTAILLMRKASSLIVPVAPTAPPPPVPATPVAGGYLDMEAKVVTKAVLEHDERTSEVITVVIQGAANPDKPIYVCGGCGYAIRSSGCAKHPDAPMTLIGHEP